MGGLFGGAADILQPDTSYLEQQQQQAEEDKAKAERENEAKKRALLGRRGRSLLQWGSDLGVTNAVGACFIGGNVYFYFKGDKT